MKRLFELITETLGLPLEWYWEYIIMLLIGEISYRFAYRKVGDLYENGIISGSSMGSGLHWFIRLLCYVSIWAVVDGLIYVLRFITAHWQIILFASGIIAGTWLICSLAVIVMRNIKLRR